MRTFYSVFVPNFCDVKWFFAIDVGSLLNSVFFYSEFPVFTELPLVGPFLKPSLNYLFMKKFKNEVRVFNFFDRTQTCL